MTQHLGQAQEQILAESDARTLKWALYEAAETQFDNFRRTLIQKIMTMEINKEKGFFTQLQEEIDRFKNHHALERIVKSVTTGESLKEIKGSYIDEHVHEGSQVIDITQVEKEKPVIENNISEEIIQVEKEVMIPVLKEGQQKNEELSTQNKAEVTPKTPELPEEISSKDQKTTQLHQSNADELSQERDIKVNEPQVPISAESKKQPRNSPESTIIEESQQDSTIDQQSNTEQNQKDQKQPELDSLNHEAENVKPESSPNQQIENKTQEDTPSSEHHQLTEPSQQSNQEPSAARPTDQAEPEVSNDQGRFFEGDDRKTEFSQDTRHTLTKSKLQSDLQRSSVGTSSVTRFQLQEEPTSQHQGSVTKSHLPKLSSKERSISQIQQSNQESNEDEQRNRKTTPELNSTERLQTVQEAPQKKEESAISSNQQVVEKEEKPSNLENQVSESVSEMPAKVEQSKEQQSKVQSEEKKVEEKKVEGNEQKVEANETKGVELTKAQKNKLKRQRQKQKKKQLNKK